MICKYCNVETALSGLAHFNKHVKWCDVNPKKIDALEKLRESRPGGINHPGENQYTKAAKEGRRIEVSHETRKKLSNAGKGKVHSHETKFLLSDQRKKWLKDNPDLHPWKRHDKFRSVPCEVLKTALREVGIQFQEEYTPLEDRAFSVDIAFPDQKLAVEVNGEQHYNRDGSLRSDYRDRHELIEKSGWHVLELHYAKCYEPHLDETLKLVIESIS